MIIVVLSFKSSAKEFSAPIDLRGKTVAEVPSVEVIAEGTNAICLNRSVVLRSGNVVVIITCFAKGIY
jgi:hypothetical protein